MRRTFLAYVPVSLAPGAPLLLVFHPSGQDGAAMQQVCGFEFERLADEHGFAVIYPDGFEFNWNDARRDAQYPARAQNIDDEGFVRALIARARDEHAIDPARVLATGYSSGGQLVFRLAMRMPSEIAAGAAIAASLPTPENSEFPLTAPAFPMLIINGTSDPMNPFRGGKVALYGRFGSRGAVQSSMDSARAFALAQGCTEDPHVFSGRDTETTSFSVTATSRAAASATAPVSVLVAVKHGGHQVPQPVTRGVFFLGRTITAVNAPELIWSFFAGHLSGNHSFEEDSMS